MNFHLIGTRRASTNTILKALFALLVLGLLVGFILPVKAQNVKASDKVLKDTVIASKSYKLYLGSRGGKYVIRVSKTGNTYKQYVKK